MDLQGPDEEFFTIRMRDLVVHIASPSLFGSLVTILAPHIWVLKTFMGPLAPLLSVVDHTFFCALIVSTSPASAIGSVASLKDCPMWGGMIKEEIKKK